MNMLKSVSIVLCIMFIQLNSVAQKVNKLSTHNYINEYSVIGSFTDSTLNYSFSQVLEHNFIDETKLNEADVLFGKAKIIKANKKNELVLSDYFENKTNAVAYAMFKVNATKNAKALLVFKVDNGAKIYLNNKLIHAGYNKLAVEEKCWLALKKGLNTVIVKVANQKDNWFLKAELLDEKNGLKHLQKISKENDFTEFLNSNLKIKTDVEGSYTFYEGRFPELVFENPELIKKHLGGSYEMSVKWYNGDVEQVYYPTEPGRYAYYAVAKGKNGKTIRKSATLYCAPTNWKGWNNKLDSELSYFPIYNIDSAVWKLHKKAISNYNGFITFTSIMEQKQGAVLLAFLSDAQKNKFTPSVVNNPVVIDGDYHAKLKQNILGVENKYKTLNVVSESNLTKPVLHKPDSSKKAAYKDFVTDLRNLCTEWAKVGDEPFDMLIAQNGTIILHDSFGNSAYEDFTTETHSEVASISKLISGILFAQFIDQGLVKLDDPVGKYLPDYPIKGKQAVTLRQCFTHTTGFVGHGQYGGMHNNWLENTLLLSLNNKAVAKQHHYNGMGYDLAGKVMEVISGKSVFRLLYENLYNPLAMENTFHDWDLGYSCHSTAYDLAKVAQLLLNKGTYGDKKLFSENTFNQILPRDLNDYYKGIDVNWGIGLVKIKPIIKDSKTGEERVLLSNSIIGHGSATQSLLLVDMEHDIIITQTRRKGSKYFNKYYKQMLLLVENFISKTE